MYNGDTTFFLEMKIDREINNIVRQFIDIR